MQSESNAIRSEVDKVRSTVVSALTLALAERDDAFLRTLLDKVEKEKLHSVTDFRRALLPSGTFMSRDGIAMGQGLRLAPHQTIMAEAAALHAPSVYAAQLADIARQAGSHLLRRSRRLQKEKLVGTNVFIGHGRSPAWRELKDFVKDRVRLPYDEFNRVPVAGVTNIARLSEMLDAAAIAFLVLTAEDERADGEMQARMNVIHEVGLFQGRLGFGRAIVVLEEGCSEFTNIQGLGQIRFPSGRISAAFEEIRQVLEREGLIQT
jgi:predicted nucleotide-binding protein